MKIDAKNITLDSMDRHFIRLALREYIRSEERKGKRCKTAAARERCFDNAARSEDVLFCHFPAKKRDAS